MSTPQLDPAASSPIPLVHHVAQRKNVVLALVLVALVAIAVGALVFGPARGARTTSVRCAAICTDHARP